MFSYPSLRGLVQAVAISRCLFLRATNDLSNFHPRNSLIIKQIPPPLRSRGGVLLTHIIVFLLTRLSIFRTYCNVNLCNIYLTIKYLAIFLQFQPQ